MYIHSYACMSMDMQEYPWNSCLRDSSENARFPLLCWFFIKCNYDKEKWKSRVVRNIEIRLGNIKSNQIFVTENPIWSYGHCGHFGWSALTQIRRPLDFRRGCHQAADVGNQCSLVMFSSIGLGLRLPFVYHYPSAMWLLLNVCLQVSVLNVLGAPEGRKSPNLCPAWDLGGHHEIHQKST